MLSYLQIYLQSDFARSANSSTVSEQPIDSKPYLASALADIRLVLDNLPCIVLGMLGEFVYKDFWRSRFLSIGLRAVIITLVVAGSFGCSKDGSTSETKGARMDIHNSQV